MILHSISQLRTLTCYNQLLLVLNPPNSYHSCYSARYAVVIAIPKLILDAQVELSCPSVTERHGPLTLKVLLVGLAVHNSRLYVG